MSPEQRVKQATQRRATSNKAWHDAIRDASAAGLSHRKIAVVAGVSHQRVAQILAE